MQRVKCHLCGSNDSRLMCEPPKAAGPIVQCRHCKLVYVNPILHDPATAYDLDRSRGNMSMAHHAIHLTEGIQRRQALRSLDFRDRLRYARRFTSGQKLLDIGCYIGTLLTLAREMGYDVCGVEPMMAASDYVRRRLGLEVFTGPLEQAAFERDSFDVVTLIHVLEHLHNPMVTLREVYRIIRPGGVFVVEVPNIESLSAKILGVRWRNFIPGHLIYFAPETLKSMLWKTGFQVLNLQRVGRTMSIGYFVALLGKHAAPVGKLASLLVRPGLSDRAIRLNVGDIIVAYARKTDGA